MSGRAVIAICAVLTAVLLSPMLGTVIDTGLDLEPSLQFALATAVLLLGGARFYRPAWRAVRAGSGNMDLLVVIGTWSAWLLSVWLWLGRGADGHALYFETAATVTTLVLVGRFLEYRAKRRTLAALDALSALQPQAATRVFEGPDGAVAEERSRPRRWFPATSSRSAPASASPPTRWS